MAYLFFVKIKFYILITQGSLMQNDYIIDLNSTNIQETLDKSNQKPLVLVCWASMSPESITITTHLENLCNKYNSQFILAKLDCEKEQMLAMQFGVQSIPTVAVFKDGQPVDGIASAESEIQLEEFLKKYLPNEDDLKKIKAFELVKAQDFSNALPLLKELALKFKDNNEIKLKLAHANIATNQFNLAEDILATVTMQDHNSLYKTLMAKIKLHHAAGETPEIRELETKLNNKPNDFSIMLKLAIQYNEVQKQEQSLELLIKILEQDLSYQDNDVKKITLDILTSMAQTDPVAILYRRKLYSLLY